MATIAHWAPCVQLSSAVLLCMNESSWWWRWSIHYSLFKLFCGHCIVFTTRRRYASAVLRVAILSVCPSVLLSDTRMLCDKTKQCTAGILLPHERAITLVFWHPQWLVGDAPFCLKFALKGSDLPPFEKRRLRQMSAYNVSTVRDCEHSSIMTNRKSTTGFPTSYRWSAYVTPESLKGWLKKRFFC